jgi:hypothetical protein
MIKKAVPPQDVAAAAERGLNLRREFGRGGTPVGVARARDLMNRKNIPLDTIRRMKAFFDRHEQNKDTPPEEGNGQIAWLLWGGDPGRRWAESVLRRESVAKKKKKMKKETEIQTLIFDKDKFTEAQVRRWIDEHDFEINPGLDETENSFRARQRDPIEFQEGSFRTIEITDGVQAVIGRLKEEYIEKGLISGEMESGVHAHTLLRNELRTREDGPHRHMFLIDGQVYLTDEDGEHEHSLASASDRVTGAGVSAHQHVLRLNDMVYVTQKDGQHQHSADLLETTGVDGAHKHTIVIDGEEYESMHVSDYIAEFGVPDMSHLGPMPAIREILDMSEIYEEIVQKQVKAFDMKVPFQEPFYKGMYGMEDDEMQKLKEFAMPRMPVAMYILPLGEDAMLMKQDRMIKLYTKEGEMKISEEMRKLLTDLPTDFLIEGMYDGKDFWAYDAAYIEQELDKMDYLERREALEMMFQKEMGFVHLLPMKMIQGETELAQAYDEMKKSYQPLLLKGGFGPWMKENPQTMKMISVQPYEMKIMDKRGQSYVLASEDDMIFGKTVSDLKLSKGEIVQVYAGDFNPMKKEFEYLKMIDKGEMAMGSELIMQRAMNMKMESMIQKNHSILKAEDDKQMVFGVVLSPEEFDLQGDIIAADEIEKTAHNFMKEYRVVGLGHEKKANAKVIESYIARKAFDMNGEKVKKGAWVLGVHVEDKNLWNQIKSGEIKSFSIGGTGQRKPVASDA